MVVARPSVYRQSYAAKSILLCDRWPQAVVQRATASHGIDDETGGCAAKSLYLVLGGARNVSALNQW